MSKLKTIKDLVHDAIDKGATNVEDIHRAIAAMPLEQLEKIAALEEPARGVKDFQDKTIGNVYETIRLVNDRAGIIAEDVLSKRQR